MSTKHLPGKRSARTAYLRAMKSPARPFRAGKLPIFLIAGALAATTALLADDDDPPRRAARLGFLDGTVSLQPAGVDDWVSAELNRPLTTGDRLWIQEDGRAELSIGSALMRLNRRTAAAFVNLDDHITQVEISAGTMVFTIRDLTNGEAFEVDTPQLAFTVLRPGKYRIDVNEQGDATLVTVVSGEGEATAAGQAYTVLPAERVKITADPPVYTKETAPGADPFDQWCAQRDKRDQTSISAQYVAQDIPGVEDLDDNGIWRANPEYGEMWMPTGVPDDWAPYRAGHWDWIEPWGWTWVDDMPWGYAPFHYGRWVFVTGGWGWVPGPLGGPAFFAPALVAWLGGDGFVFGGELAIGWVPLAPGELFIPGYRVSGRYFEVVNARNTVASRTHIRNGYANFYLNHSSPRSGYLNEHARGGTTVMPHSAMASGKPVMKSMVSPSKGTLAFKSYQQNAPVAPRRESVAGGRASTLARPPAGVTSRTIMTKVSPPLDRPSFQQRESALRAHPGQPVDRSTISNVHAGVGESHRTYQSATAKPAPKSASTPPPVGTSAGRGDQPVAPKKSSFGSITKSPGRPAGATGPASMPGSKNASAGTGEAGPPSTPKFAGGGSAAPKPSGEPVSPRASGAEGRGSAPGATGKASIEEHRTGAPRQAAPEHHAAAPAPAPPPRQSAPAPAPAPRPAAPVPAPAPRQSAPAPAPAPRPYIPPHH
jgi:FecR protein